METLSQATASNFRDDLDALAAAMEEDDKHVFVRDPREIAFQSLQDMQDWLSRVGINRLVPDGGTLNMLHGLSVVIDPTMTVPGPVMRLPQRYEDLCKEWWKLVAQPRAERYGTGL